MLGALITLQNGSSNITTQNGARIIQKSGDQLSYGIWKNSKHVRKHENVKAKSKAGAEKKS
jgi:hypothetical protein